MRRVDGAAHHAAPLQNVLPAVWQEVAAAPIDDEPVAAPLVGPTLCLWSLPMWPDYRCPCARAPAYTAITGGRARHALLRSRPVAAPQEVLEQVFGQHLLKQVLEQSNSS